MSPRRLLVLLVFAAASVAIHYQVKVRMAHGGSPDAGASGKQKRGDAAPDLAGASATPASLRAAGH